MKKRIIISVSALLVLAVIFGLLSALVPLKYTDPKQWEGRLCGEYYDVAGGHDVLFVGDCEVYETFVPTTLWQEYGITSYVRGTPQQLVWQSYYLLEEMLKYEKPRAVVYNVLALKYGTPQDEGMNRMTLDGMKWSVEKLKAINASMTEEESLLDYVFPLLRYHSRITELEADDFKYAFREPPTVSHGGYLMQTDIVPVEKDIKPISNFDPLPQTAMDYLEKMRVLCEENGIELILVKAPTNSWRFYWYDQWETQICEYAQEKELSYYNLIDKCDIDWSTDTYDKGLHLNVYGAEKASRYFGEILQDKHGISDRREEETTSKLWQSRVDKYNEDKKQREENRK